MLATILYLFFLTTCGFAQATSLLYSADNNLLDVKKLPFAEENPPNPDDADISDNVEDLQRELIAERIKNRDLNQTISDILGRMEEMEKNIMRNEEKITDNESSVFLLSRDVEDLTDDVATVQGDVVSVTADVEKNTANITKVLKDVASNQGDITEIQGNVAAVQGDVDDLQEDVASVQGDVAAVQDDVVAVAVDVERNFADITTLSTFGTWCGVQDQWSTVGTITYDSITFSASNNMNYATTPLDINSGINRHNCYYYLDIDICHISGIFTVPVSGAWRVSYHMESRVDGGNPNYCYLYINGDKLPETSQTYSESRVVTSTGGRVVTLEASAGDKIEIKATQMDGIYRYVQYCAEYTIPEM